MFDKPFNDLMPIEGGDKYTNYPGDLPTRWGITEPVARAFGYQGDMKDLPMYIAKAIYKQEYWDKMHLDDVAKLSYDIAWQLFNIGVNQGITWQVKFLQRALNLVAIPITIDGFLGKNTLIALDIFLQDKKLNDLLMLSMLKAQQILRYIEIVESNPAKAANLNGWIRRVGL